MCQAQSLPWGGWEIERHAGRWVQNNCCSYPRQWQFCGSEVGQPRLLLFPDQDFEGGLEAYGKDQGVYASGVLRNYVDFGRIWGSLGTQGSWGSWSWSEVFSTATDTTRTGRAHNQLFGEIPLVTLYVSWKRLVEEDHHTKLVYSVQSWDSHSQSCHWQADGFWTGVPRHQPF